MPAVVLIMGIVALGVTCAIGWILNIIKLATMTGAADHIAMLVLRVVGIFVPPLGVILGLFVA